MRLAVDDLLASASRTRYLFHHGGPVRRHGAGPGANGAPRRGGGCVGMVVVDLQGKSAATGQAAACEPIVRPREPLGAPSAPASRDHEGCVVKGAVVRPVGLSFDPRFPFDDWRHLGARIAMRSNASLWWLGDWLAFGREKYGRLYKDGVALTGLDYQTLRNYAAVARRFELSRRRDKVSFQHHAEVCAMADAEQDRWLERAEFAGWSRNEFRRRLRSELAAPTSARPAPLRLLVDADRRRLWGQAAVHDDCDLQAWVLRTLDEAAAKLLSAS